MLWWNGWGNWVHLHSCCFCSWNCFHYLRIIVIQYDYDLVSTHYLGNGTSTYIAKSSNRPAGGNGCNLLSICICTTPFCPWLAMYGCLVDRIANKWAVILFSQCVIHLSSALMDCRSWIICYVHIRSCNNFGTTCCSALSMVNCAVSVPTQ